MKLASPFRHVLDRLEPRLAPDAPYFTNTVNAVVLRVCWAVKRDSTHVRRVLLFAFEIPSTASNGPRSP